MTIQEVGMTFYLMEEDTIKYEFTDEMIEGLVDEPQEKMNESPNVKNVISTRKEQIFEYLKERNIPFDSLEANSIIEGIEWADSHPNKKWIEKARRWLKSNTNWDDEWDEMGRNANYGKIDEFCKEMEK